MKELTNKDVYDFLEEEIACHPKLSDKFGGNLKEHEGDNEFWEELSDNLDCFTICDICGKPMIEGYIMNGSHYCSDACLHEDFSDEQIAELCREDNDECYYTNWYEDSISNNKH